MHEIKHPITGKPTGERLQVHQNNFKNKMDWHKAKKKCEELGNGWRLPTKSELELIHTDLIQNGNINFKKDYYWSKTETSSLRVWALHFGYSIEDFGYRKNSSAFVCAVRTI
jgi:hypothetical protein